MKRLMMVVAVGLLGACAQFQGHGQSGGHGVRSVPSPYDVRTTIDRFEAAAKARNLNVFARIDHAGGAQKINRNLRPTELLIFGNPQGGTPLMECKQSIGIDLPLKALAWQDAQGQVWLSYNEVVHLAHRHALGDCGAAAVGNITKALDGLAAEATKR